MTFVRKQKKSGARTTWQAGALAFMATLLGLPAQAGINDFPIPAQPLSVRAGVAPNLLLLLDDSGSMRWTVMPNPDVRVIRTPPDNRGQWVEINTDVWQAAWLVPHLNKLAYDPRVTYLPWRRAEGGYYPDMNPASTYDNDDLMAGNLSLYSHNNWFYAINNHATDESDLSQYTLYILGDGDQRAVQCDVAKKDARGNWINPGVQAWPGMDCQGTTRFTWVTQSGETISRSLAEEWRNYANWYGYHRTRMKVAKAAISEVFSNLGENNRLGYAVLNATERNLNIPVQSDGGLFRGNNRQAWFERVLSQTSSGGTPLRRSLQRAGDYFSRTDVNGPWGPELPGQQIACRQNFTILATDGEWNGSPPIGIGNQDDTAGPLITGPEGRQFQYQPGPPFRDNASDTLADVAMRYWKQDLRPDLENIVPASTENPAFWQHMVTFTISIGLKGTLDPVRDLPALRAGNQAWPSPVADQISTLDDLFHASVNGRGSHTTALNPQALSDGLTTALNAITQRLASSSGLSFNGSEIKAGRLSYVPSYAPERWSGELTAFQVTANGIGTEPVWRASQVIVPFGTDGGPGRRRYIYTHGNAGQSGSVRAAEFPTSAQRAALSQEVADWIRGDRSREDAPLRVREHLLGDIVHSSPVFIKTRDNHQSVLVGANDGMLHVFTDDREQFAYLPGMLDMARLRQNSQREGFRHQYFVDGQIAAHPSNSGNTVTVVAGLGRGGRGVFGLQFDAGAVGGGKINSWEYPGDADMGMVLAKPQIYKVQGYTASGSDQYSVLVPNGINSPNGKAALYILDARTGQVQKKIVASNETGNGLSSLTAVSSRGDGWVDVVYAGDMRGNVWRFYHDLTGKWTVTKVFTATDAQGNRQPISGGIGVAIHPVRLIPWVFFGTGRHLTAEDQSSIAVQSWYGVEDGGVNGMPQNPFARADLVQRRITGQQMVDGRRVRTFSTAVSNDMARRKGWVLDLVPPNGASEGERMLGEPLIMGSSTLAASSMVPTGGGCGGQGRGYLNVIDLFTGGATAPTFDLNGDGRVDGTDPSIPGNNSAVGSVDLGVGAISDPGVLLGKLPGTGTNGTGEQPIICVNGANGLPVCMGITWGPGYGRVGWREIVTE